MDRTILVRMGENVVVRDDNNGIIKLKTILGSCVGIILVDPHRKIAGLSHIMLPEKTEKDPIITKYADTAIPDLIEKLSKKGALKKNLKAYIVGGACMFNNANQQTTLNIGEKNYKKVIEVISEFNIPVVLERKGGNRGKTIIYNLRDDTIEVKTLQINIREKR